VYVSPPQEGISANAIWGENIKRGKRKRGKCEGIRRKDEDKGEIAILRVN
jgi:hypothetical protein